MESAIKFDQGKPPWHLLPFDAIDACYVALDRNLPNGNLVGHALQSMSRWWQVGTGHKLHKQPYLERAFNYLMVEMDPGWTIEGLPQYSAMPWDSISQVVQVLEFGAKKYTSRNWELGLDYSRPYSAAWRHVIAHLTCETNDPETGLPHLAHAGCCLLFLIAFECRAMREFDDRPTKGEKQ